jgi:hypothetical protein
MLMASDLLQHLLESVCAPTRDRFEWLKRALDLNCMSFLSLSRASRLLPGSSTFVW